MPIPSKQIGRHYRHALQNKLSITDGICYLNGCWLVFPNHRILILYSKYSTDRDEYFYGIDMKFWEDWKNTDCLVFLLPPAGYDNEISSQIHYLELSPILSRDLINSVRKDSKNQKKVSIRVRSGRYDIQDCPFPVLKEFIHVMVIDSDATNQKPEIFDNAVSISRGIDSIRKATSRKAISLVITGAATTRRETKRRGNFSKLHEHLNQVNKSQKQLMLTFEEFKAIIRNSLPQSAYEGNIWWKNNLGKKLSETDWELHNIYVRSEQLVLRRKGADMHNLISEYVKNLLEGVPMRGTLDPYTLQEWLTYCQRIGWYYEGTVLFEKSGIDIDRLSDTLRCNIEEHYNVCKREINRTNNLELLGNMR